MAGETMRAVLYNGYGAGAAGLKVSAGDPCGSSLLVSFGKFLVVCSLRDLRISL